MNRTDFLRVFTGIGLYDLMTPYDHTRYMVSQLNLPPGRVDDIVFSTYEGGHMMYMNPEAHLMLRDDLEAFYRETLE